LRHFHIYGFAAWEVHRLAYANPVRKKAKSMRATTRVEPETTGLEEALLE
jgi:hypothetical protein